MGKMLVVELIGGPNDGQLVQVYHSNCTKLVMPYRRPSAFKAASIFSDTPLAVVDGTGDIGMATYQRGSDGKYRHVR